MKSIEPPIVSKMPAVRSHMMLQQRRTPAEFPFSAPSIEYFYFCRNAIWHLVRLMDLAGGEILVPAYHHGVEVEAMLDAGARVRFFRVDAGMNPDLEDMEKKITGATRAIYLIHYLGFPGPIREVNRLATQRGLKVIEDCALSLLSKEGDAWLGSAGDASVFCFYKTLPVPHGGAMVFNRPVSHPPLRIDSPTLDSTLSHLAASWLLMNPDLGSVGRGLHAILQPLGKAVFTSTARTPRVDPGTMHFDPRNLHLGMSRLAQHLVGAQDFAGIIARRRRNYEFLLHELADVARPVFPDLPAGVCPLFYPLVVRDKTDMMAALLRRRIETVDFWRHGYPGCRDSEYPEVAELRRSVLELPCHQDLDQEALRHMVSAVKQLSLQALAA